MWCEWCMIIDYLIEAFHLINKWPLWSTRNGTKPSQFDCGNKTALCTHRHDSSSSFKSVSPTDRMSKFCSGVSFTLFHVSTDRVAHSIAMIGFCFSIGTSAFSEPWSRSWWKSFNKGSAPLPAKLRLTGVVPSTVLLVCSSLHCAINAIKPNMNVIAIMIVSIRTAGMVLRRRIFVVHESRQSSCVMMLTVHVGWGSWRMNECCGVDPTASSWASLGWGTKVDYCCYVVLYDTLYGAAPNKIERSRAISKL